MAIVSSLNVVIATNPSNSGGFVAMTTTDLPKNYSDVVPEGRRWIDHAASPGDAYVDHYDPFEKLLTRAVKWALSEGKPIVRIRDIEFYLPGDDPKVFNRVAAEGVRIAVCRNSGDPKVMFKTHCQSSGQRREYRSPSRPSVWKLILWIE